MVNLLLCGRAHSNVFNGTKTMEGAAESGDSVILRGVPARCTFLACPHSHCWCNG